MASELGQASQAEAAAKPDCACLRLSALCYPLLQWSEVSFDRSSIAVLSPSRRRQDGNTTQHPCHRPHPPRTPRTPNNSQRQWQLCPASRPLRSRSTRRIGVTGVTAINRLSIIKNKIPKGCFALSRGCLARAKS
jgi:hypothetical protein